VLQKKQEHKTFLERRRCYLFRKGRKSEPDKNCSKSSELKARSTSTEKSGILDNKKKTSETGMETGLKRPATLNKPKIEKAAQAVTLPQENHLQKDKIKENLILVPENL